MENSKNNQLVGINKRKQIANTNRTIFIWVIAASVAVAFCGVTVQFLARQAIFNQKVIGAKLDTQSTLNNNITNVAQLKTNVDELLANDNLASVKANTSDSNLKVVLDALPTENDRAGLGASLQQVILSKSGVDTSALSTISDEDADADAAGTADLSSGVVPTSQFRFTTKSDYARTTTMFKDLERTIRPMNVTVIGIESNEGGVETTVQGSTYYLPQQTVQLGKKTITP